MDPMPEYRAGLPVEQLGGDVRARFVQRTYTHLLGAVLGFVAVEALLFSSGLAAPIAQAMLGVNWLLVLGAFMVVGWLASRTAHRTAGLGAQYAALAAFVVAEAILFLPLLYVAEATAGGGVIQSAAMVTALGFAGLTLVAFKTRRDFSFLRGFLWWGGMMALVVIAAAVLFGLDLGTWFSLGMVAFAGCAILYDTSQVLHHYPEDRYVAASLELFASVALMFWYVLRLFMSRD